MENYQDHPFVEFPEGTRCQSNKGHRWLAFTTESLSYHAKVSFEMVFIKCMHKYNHIMMYGTKSSPFTKITNNVFRLNYHLIKGKYMIIYQHMYCDALPKCASAKNKLMTCNLPS